MARIRRPFGGFLSGVKTPQQARRLRRRTIAAMRGPARPRPAAIPPPGWYDPALDAQRRASKRGLGDLRQDTELGNARAAQDYTFGVEDLRRGEARGLGDLLQQRNRGFEDLGTSRTREGEDYGRNVGLLQRSYQQLQRRQGEGARQAGVLSAGIAAKAAQVRAQNMAIERQPMDTAHTRFLSDNTLARTRLGADYTNTAARLRQDTSVGVGRLGVGYARGTYDRGTALDRARREAAEFGLDIGEQQRFQAIQGGWNPPPPPPPGRPRRRPRFRPNQSLGWWGGPGATWGGR